MPRRQPRSELIGCGSRAERGTKETLKMSDPVAAVSQTQPATQPADVRPRAPATPPQSVPTDTVQLSSAAQAALQEALETPAQTAKEASTGDPQARRLLAREAAAKAEAKPTETPHTTHVVA